MWMRGAEDNTVPAFSVGCVCFQEAFPEQPRQSPLPFSICYLLLRCRFTEDEPYGLFLIAARQKTGTLTRVASS